MPKMQHLPIEQAIYVPATKNKSRKITSAALASRVTDVRRYLSKRYGGYTSVKGVGGYVLKNGKVVKETSIRVASFGQKSAYLKNKAAIKTQASRWAQRWGQESVGYEREGDMYLVYPPRKRRR
jgi:hypothetical protein